MAMFTTRLVLRRLSAVAPRATSRGLGMGLRRATEDPSSRRLLPVQLLPRLFSSNAPAPGETPRQLNKHFPPLGYQVDASLEMEYKHHEEKRMELICLLIKAIDTCEPAHRDRVMEKYKEVEAIRRDYLAKKQHSPPLGHQVEANLEMEYNRHEEKRMELICLLIKAIDTCEPAQRDRVMEKYKEVEATHRDYLAKVQANGQKNGYKTHGEKKSWNVWDLLSYSVSGIFLGLTLGELEAEME